MIVIAIDGVLRDSLTRETVPAGRVLYRALADNYGGLALLADDLEQDRLWLRAHGFTDHHIEVTGSRSEQITKIRQRGSVAFVVESSPAGAADLLHLSVPVLFFAIPAYTAADFLPGTRRIPSAWDSLLAAQAQQTLSRQEDTRLNEMQEIL